MTISQSRRRSKTIIIFRNDNPGLELMITIWSGGCSVAMCWSVCSLCWSPVSTVHCRARPAVPVSACLHLWLQSVQWSFVLPSTNISQLASVNLPHQHHQPPTNSFIWYLPCSSLQCSISFISDFWCSLNIEHSQYILVGWYLSNTLDSLKTEQKLYIFNGFQDKNTALTSPFSSRVWRHHFREFF